MATVREILGKKGSDVISVPPMETVVKAAQLMNERGIGGLVVTDGKRLAGIFTERAAWWRSGAIPPPPKSAT